jgi:hypothetical protein
MQGELSGGASFEKIGKLFMRLGSCMERQKKYEKAMTYYGKSKAEDNNRFVRNALR